MVKLTYPVTEPEAAGSVVLLNTDSEIVDFPMRGGEVLTHSLLELQATCA